MTRRQAATLWIGLVGGVQLIMGLVNHSFAGQSIAFMLGYFAPALVAGAIAFAVTRPSRPKPDPTTFD